MEQQLILDRYRPLEELGEGAFGSVVLAWDTRMQRRVAIKRLPLPVDSAGRPLQAHGLTEARTAAMLGHPAIVTVFDFDTDSDEAFLVMEYVDGASLAEVLDDVGGPLTLDEAASVLDDVASALEFAHDNGVLHLDIKPENVLVTRGGRAKVADFGMAELSSLSGHGPAYGGTPGYMPLEQLQGATVTERTDEWALAALAYEVLTGDNPFADETVEASVMRLQVFDPPLPSEYAPELAGAIDDVVLAGLGPHPADRYPSVTAFAEALLPHLGDPAAGRASLASLVAAYAEDDAPAAERGLARLGAWDRLRGSAGAALVRALAAIEAGWLAWGGLAPFALERPAFLGAAALVASAGALAPGLGIGLGLGCFVAGLAATGAWLVAGVLLLAGGGWWWLAARHDAGAAVLPMSAPALGIARASLLQPLLAGFSLTPLAAAATALLGGALAMLAAAASAQGPPYLAVWPGYALDVWQADLAETNVRLLVVSPASYVALLGWPISAVFMSLAAGRATRGGAVLGAAGALGLLGGAYLLANAVADALSLPTGWDGSGLLVTLAVSGIAIGGVIVLGPPVRAEEE